MLTRAQLNKVLSDELNTPFSPSLSVENKNFQHESLNPLNSEALSNGIRLAQRALESKVALRGFSYHVIPYEDAARQRTFDEGFATKTVGKVEQVLEKLILTITSEKDLKLEGKRCYAVYDRNWRTIILNESLLLAARRSQHDLQTLFFSFLIGAKIIHEIGHALFFLSGAAEDPTVDSPRGVLRAESGYAIEEHLFGGQIFDYGSKEDEFDVRLLVTRLPDDRAVRMINVHYIRRFFDESFWTDVRKLDDFRITFADTPHQLASIVNMVCTVGRWIGVPRDENSRMTWFAFGGLGTLIYLLFHITFTVERRLSRKLRRQLTHQGFSDHQTSPHLSLIPSTAPSRRLGSPEPRSNARTANAHPDFLFSPLVLFAPTRNDSLFISRDRASQL